jgi:hypothetical protein
MSEANPTQNQIDELSRLLLNLHQTNNDFISRIKIYNIKVYTNSTNDLYLSYFSEFPNDDHVGVELFLLKINPLGKSSIMNETMGQFDIQNFIGTLTETKLQ